MNNYDHLFSLLTVFISIQTLRELYQTRQQFWDRKVTLADQYLSTRLSLFILVPFGVLLHEIGHSLATWQVGGTVETFRWFFFSGYIIPSGIFSFEESWWIFFAGNLMSIMLAILPIPVIFLASRRIVGEIFYRFVGIQSIYCLVWYPLYSIFTKQGDWVVIYYPGLQPFIYYLAMAHIGLLLGLWHLYRSPRMLQWRLTRYPHNLDHWQKLKLESTNRPNDLQPKLNLVYFLVEHHEIREAKKIARKIRRSHSHEISIQVLQTFVGFYKQSYNRQKSYHKAIKSALKLLNTDLSTDDKIIFYRLLCSASYRVGKLQEAVEYANCGLAITPKNYMLLCHRANTYYLLKKKQAAIADIESAFVNTDNEDIQELLLKLRTKCLMLN